MGSSQETEPSTMFDPNFARLPGRFVLMGEEKKDFDEEILRYSGCVFYDFNNFSKDLYESYWQQRILGIVCDEEK